MTISNIAIPIRHPKIVPLPIHDSKGMNLHAGLMDHLIYKTKNILGYLGGNVNK